MKPVFSISVFLIAIFCVCSFADYSSKRCDDERNFLNRVWGELSQQEPMLSNAYDKTRNASGTTELFNCVIRWPHSNGEPVEGRRTVVFDQQWYTRGKFQHHGFRLRYWLTLENSRLVRKVESFETCRTPGACAELGIPSPSTGPRPPTVLEHSSGGTNARIKIPSS